jgi:hypothetical protein
MERKTSIVPPGEHPFDPVKPDIDPVAFALDKVQTLLVWIDEHRASFEKARRTDPETAESELSNLRIATRDAMIHLQRFSDLFLAGYTIDANKRLPESLSGAWFSTCVERVLAAEKDYNQNSRDLS